MPASPSASADQPVDALEMGARGDLRHHAAEAAMLGQLAVDDVGQDLAARSGAEVARAGASTMATAVSSQLVSMPSTRMRVF